MLDRLPRIADPVEPLWHSDVMRVISIAAICAARRAIASERYAHAIKQAEQDFPSVPVLMRDPKASLDVHYSRQLVSIAVAFIETLARLSAAAELKSRSYSIACTPEQKRQASKKAMKGQKDETPPPRRRLRLHRGRSTGIRAARRNSTRMDKRGANGRIKNDRVYALCRGREATSHQHWCLS
jgi:hypothetical protein